MRAVKREQGLCVQSGCDREKLTHSSYCFRHWAGSAVKYDYALIEQLRVSWNEQRGRCAITNRPLQPGVNASLDHIVPKSRGGADDLDNLRWTTLTANRARGDLTDQELFDFLHDAYHHMHAKGFRRT